MMKLGRVVIKEELVALTGDYKLAIVLNQMLYWSERVADFDKFLLEEKNRMRMANMDPSCLELRHGWIYKKADELAKECMMTNSEATMRRYLDKLCEHNWLSKRTNPKYRWDKTLQYRVNVSVIQRDLAKLGYFLEGYKLPSFENDGPDFQIESLDFQFENSNGQNENTYFQNDDSDFHDESAIPETTSETTTEITPKITSFADTKKAISFFEQHGFGTAGSYVASKIYCWCDDLSVELVIEAMKIAVERGVSSWKYCETILRDWAGKKVKTVEQARALKYKKQRPVHSGIRRKEVLPDWFSEFENSISRSAAPQEKSPAEIEALRKRLEKVREWYRKA
ncbi:hypothetical protein BpJC7_17010 [Weizmannia acidilactici]|uniref:DnaB/C C-terminal domain-containing protein n=1 Tax=Weizmannia acidilactici TaxID=2607726 RepID=A0A5J4JIV2_9BACI|nr:DnaD domain protein [Weizmannia acidilactici]GER67974.1 hypothetical protein BpJC4_24450 [Weizmannia acidilactici]GER70398.1 hypothetical protein BpJC7_17010 [Weizmannia acidilactici]GER74432.1 hypothetical protein BpPP18_24990 [Weizmannia acidilactici]